MLSNVRKILTIVGKVELAATVAILAAIVAIILSQVFSRYVLGRPLIWAEELATYLLIWLGFTAAAVAYKLHRHITIQTFGSLLPPLGRRIMEAAIHGLIVTVLIVVVWHIPAAMRTEAMQSTVGLPVRIGLHWFFTVPTLIACLSMIVSGLFYAVDALVGTGAPLMAGHDDPSLNDDIIDDDAIGGAAP